MSRSIDRLKSKIAASRGDITILGATYRGIWDPNTVYNGGDSVAYPDATSAMYVAKAWTAGDEPGSSDVWLKSASAAAQW